MGVFGEGEQIDPAKIKEEREELTRLRNRNPDETLRMELSNRDRELEGTKAQLMTMASREAIGREASAFNFDPMIVDVLERRVQTVVNDQRRFQTQVLSDAGEPMYKFDSETQSEKPYTVTDLFREVQKDQRYGGFQRAAQRAGGDTPPANQPNAPEQTQFDGRADIAAGLKEVLPAAQP